MDPDAAGTDASIIVKTGKIKSEKVDDGNLEPSTEMPVRKTKTMASPAKRTRRQKAGATVVGLQSDDSSSELSSLSPSSQPDFFPNTQDEDEIIVQPSSPVDRKMPRSSTRSSPAKRLKSDRTAAPRNRRNPSPDELQGDVVAGPAKPSTAQAKGGARKSRFKYDNASEMLTNPNSPLGTGNLFKLITTGEGWSQLTQEQRQEILKAAPPEAVVDAGTPNARLDLSPLKNSTHFRHDVAQYQDALRQGRHDNEWIKQAQAAHGKREVGFYKDFQKVAFEADWGTPMPASPKPKDVGVSDSNVAVADTKGAGISRENDKSGTIVDTGIKDATIDNGKNATTADTNNITGPEENGKEASVEDTQMTGVTETNGEADSRSDARVNDLDRDHNIVTTEPSQQGNSVPPPGPNREL